MKNTLEGNNNRLTKTEICMYQQPGIQTTGNQPIRRAKEKKKRQG